MGWLSTEVGGRICNSSDILYVAFNDKHGIRDELLKNLVILTCKLPDQFFQLFEMDQHTFLQACDDVSLLWNVSITFQLHNHPITNVISFIDFVDIGFVFHDVWALTKFCLKRDKTSARYGWWFNCFQITIAKNIMLNKWRWSALNYLEWGKACSITEVLECQLPNAKTFPTLTISYEQST